ncbi:hypothetical protein [Paracoccus sp. NSM]
MRIRDDVAVHSGRPLTAEDVVSTLQQVADPANASQISRRGSSTSFSGL